MKELPAGNAGHPPDDHYPKPPLTVIGVWRAKGTTWRLKLSIVLTLLACNSWLIVWLLDIKLDDLPWW